MSSGKPKALLKQARGKKKKEQILDDADDYLAAGVDDEDAMGKHRGGDPIKSLRFARKALDLYTQGLLKYPKSFDLAYNKARLELEIATHPALVKVLDVPVVTVLQQALGSHRYAISLNPDNADTMFNTAQVLTTIAEYIAKHDSLPEDQALKYLEEALEYQNQCLQIQHTKFEEGQSMHEAAMNQSLHDTSDNEDEDGGVQLDSTTASAYENGLQDEGQQEQWVSIIEPVTADTLIDTILSQLSTLTTLCTILTSSPSSSSLVNPAWIEDYSSPLITKVLPSIMTSPKNTTELNPRMSEIHRTIAIFKASLLDLAYHTNSIDIETYLSTLAGIFASAETSDPDTQIAHARALITANASLSDNTAPPLPRWTILARANTLLTTTSQHPTTKTDPHALATTHFLRADIALLQLALSRPPTSYNQAITYKTQLLKNAEVFYRNAGKLFSESDDEKAVAMFRSGVVEVITMVGTGDKVDPSMARKVLRNFGGHRGEEWVGKQIAEMGEEGLLEGMELPI